MIDVITVPDFSPPVSRLFEARTLFFLGSWLRNAGRAKDFALHLACIGDPPVSVEILAKRAGAKVTVFPQIAHGFGRTWNKLRGLEVTPRYDRFLLLDTDVLIGSDIFDIRNLGDCLALAPELRARIAGDTWKNIYKTVGRPIPAERIKTIIAELGATKGSLWGYEREEFVGEDDEAYAMFPYYNSGVVYGLWKMDLRSMWAESSLKVASIISKDDIRSKSLISSDQVGLAICVQILKEQGYVFKQLPQAFHCHWRHLATGALRTDDIKIYHAFRLASSYQKGASLFVSSLLDSLGPFKYSLREHWLSFRARSRPFNIRKIWETSWEAVRFGVNLQSTYWNYVRPAVSRLDAILPSRQA